MSPTEELAKRVAQLEKEVAEIRQAFEELFEPTDPLEAAFDRFRALVKAKRKAPTLRRA